MSASASITSYLPSLLATRIARQSRVYSSISVSIRIVLPCRTQRFCSVACEVDRLREVFPIDSGVMLNARKIPEVRVEFALKTKALFRYGSGIVAAFDGTR